MTSRMRARCPGRHLFPGLMMAIVMLPVMAAAQTWRKVEAEHFTIISAASERDTLAWAREFSHFIAALQRFIPMDMRRLTPLTVVICAGDRDFNRYKPVGANGRPLEMAGFFSRRDTWSVTGMAGTRTPEEVRRTVLHEGVHWFMSGFSRPNPVWVEEGVAEVFSTFVIERNQLNWGHSIPWHVQLLLDNPPLPLDQLMSLQRGMLFHGGRQVTGMAYAQSWAFAHFLLFGEHTLSRDSIGDYLELYHSALHPDEAFRRAFGGDYAEVDRQFRTYLRNGYHFVGRQPLPEMAAFTATRAEPIEVELALARLAVAGQRLPLALEHANKAVQLLPDDPRGYEMLGLVHDESDNRTAALAGYHQAAVRRSRDAQVYLQLGLEIARGDDGTVTAENARRAALYFQQSIVLNPFRPAPYRNLAGLLNRLDTIAEHDPRFIEQGRRLFPDEGIIVVGQAVLQRKAGDHEAAEALLASVIQDDRQERSARDYARQLEQSWRIQRLQESIQQLMGERRFQEVIELVDATGAEGQDVQVRMALFNARRAAQGALRMQVAREAWDARRWEDARRLYNAILESDDPLPNKTFARRQVAEMDRRNLGRTPEPAGAE